GKVAHLNSVGSYGWGGAFGTYYWIDPKEELVGVLMIQVTSYKNIRQDAHSLSLQAIVD
ncbi:MAG: serine hydrolase, partial [Candidatus Solibacter usitatus]|nr:serine hydrolase [Candidatus Solibacter usitatus]